MTSAIHLEGVVKRYPKTGNYRDLLTFWRPRQYITALCGVKLEVPKGGIFGLLGANGAGKTTLLKVLAGLILVDEGSVQINGVNVTRDPDLARESLMYVSCEERSLYWRLTGRQNLQFFAMQFDMPRQVRQKRIDELLTLVDLQEFADERVMKYSTGMRQRLAIARGMLSNPDILLLDEPTRSMDPVSARNLWEFIKCDLAQRQKKTVVVATHNMEEAAYLCDRVAILQRGRVAECDSVPALLDQMAGRGHYQITVRDAPRTVIDKLSLLNGVSQVVAPLPNGHRQINIKLLVEDPDIHIPAVVEELVRGGGRVLNVGQTQCSLGDVIASLSEESHI